MRILFVHNKYKYRGGEDTVLNTEFDLLIAKGHEVEKLIFDNNNIIGFTKKIQSGISSIYSITSARLLEEKINEFKPDVIHIHNLFFQASPSIIIKANKLNVPVVLTIHNFRLICSNALLLRNNKTCELCINEVFPLHGIKYKCYHSSSVDTALVTAITGIHKVLSTWRNKIDVIISLSSFMKEKLVNSSLRLPKNKIVIKPNFVPDSEIINYKKENFYLFVGRLTKEKGIHFLISYFLNHPNQKLKIAGDGPEFSNVLEKIKNASNIEFLGQQSKEDILKLMGASKALLFPSIWYEGLPMTIVEAFSVGTPVIASNIGSMAEMIQNEYNGFLYNPEDAKELERSINSIQNSDLTYEELCNNARKTYLKNYHPDVHYKAIMEIYLNAINNKKSGK